MPRGFMVKVQNTSSWTNLKNCFSSLPRQQSEYEMWFTKENDHDIGAVWTSSIDLIPFYSDFTNQTNRLVNLNSSVAIDRGSEIIKINASNFVGSGSVALDVIEEQWFDTKFWNSFFLMTLILSGLAVIYGYVKAPMKHPNEANLNAF